MKKCPYCAEEIADAAVVCKHCGRDQYVRPSFVKTLVILIIIGGAIVLGAIFFLGNQGTP